MTPSGKARHSRLPAKNIKADTPSAEHFDDGCGEDQRKDKSSHVAQNAVAPEPELAEELPPEHGGQAGLEPTRYGDWEKKGRCTDF